MIKLEEFMDIFRLREMGYSISGISRETGKDRKTVRKYLNQGKSKIPAMKKRLPKDSKLEPFKEYMVHFQVPTDIQIGAIAPLKKTFQRTFYK